MAVVSAEGCLPLVALFDAQEIVRTAEVQLGENLSVGKAVRRLGCKRNRLTVPHGDQVQRSIVHTQTEGCEENTRPKRGLGRTNETDL